MNNKVYAAKIIQTLLGWSVAKTYTEALNEWRYNGTHDTAGRQCELCGNTNLIYNFQIENARGHKHWLGSECIEQYKFGGYLLVGSHRKALEASRRLQADTELLEAALAASKWVRTLEADMRRSLRRHGSFTKRQRAMLIYARDHGTVQGYKEATYKRKR